MFRALAVSTALLAAAASAGCGAAESGAAPAEVAVTPWPQATAADPRPAETPAEPQLSEEQRRAQLAAWRTEVLARLRTIRTQIELYNAKNPDAPYGPATPLGGFWNNLIVDSFLSGPPQNPLQDKSITVGAGPGHGIGWIWAEGLPGDEASLSIFAVDENGRWLDERPPAELDLDADTPDAEEPWDPDDAAAGQDAPL